MQLSSNEFYAVALIFDCCLILFLTASSIIGCCLKASSEFVVYTIEGMQALSVQAVYDNTD